MSQIVVDSFEDAIKVIFDTSFSVLDVKQDGRNPSRRSLPGLLRAGCDSLPLPWIEGQPTVVVPRGDEADRARQQRQMLVDQRGEE